MISKSLNDYFDFDVVTRVEIIDEDQTTFPAVTICTYGYISYPYLTHNNIEALSCTFDQTDCINDYSSHYYMDKTCLKFNGQINLWKPTHTGRLNGLNLMIRIPETCCLTIFMNENHVEPIYYEINNIDINKWNYNQIFLRIGKEVYEKLGEPHNHCTKYEDLINNFDSAPFNYIIKANMTYRREYCLLLSEFMYNSERCNCSYPGVYETDNSNICMDNPCVIDVSQNISKLNFSHLCPLECNMTIYTTSVEKYYVETSDVHQINVLVYFESFKYKKISQVAKMTLPDIISTIGGTFGLFLGLSLLSFIEILDLFIQIFSISNQKVSNSQFSY